MRAKEVTPATVAPAPQGAEAVAVAKGPSARLPASAQKRLVEIRNWLVVALAERLDAEVGDIDPTQPFSSIGLDSKDAVGLTGDLGDWLKVSVSPTLVFDHPNAHALAEYLTRQQFCIEAEVAEKAPTALAASEPTAIIGMACRFPGANDPQEFWD